MSTEDNKRLIVDFQDRVRAGDIDHAYELITDDFCWEIMGDSVIGGRHDKEGFRKILRAVSTVFPEPPHWDPIGLIAEGDRVAAEAQASGTAYSGFEYRNRYHMLVTCRDGKMCEVKEFMDTKHLLDLMASMKEYNAASSATAPNPPAREHAH